MRLSVVYSVFNAAYAVCSPMIQALHHRDATPDPDSWHHTSEPGVPFGAGEEKSTIGQRSLNNRDLSKSVNISRRWQNKKLFDGTLALLPIGGGSGPEAIVNLKLKCIDCWTKGTIGMDFSINDEERDITDVIKSLVSSAHDATTSSLTEIFNPVLRIDLSNIELYAHIHMQLSAALAYQLRLWDLDISPFVDTRNIFQLGPSISIDLVFIASSYIDVETGFHIILPPDAFIEIDVSKGSITKQLFEGTITKTLPLQVTLGGVSLTADLRISAGFDVGLGTAITVANHKGVDRPGFVSPGNSEMDPSPQMSEDDTPTNTTESSVAGPSINRRSIGASIGVQSWVNVIEWTATITPDLHGVTNCSFMAVHYINLNVGVGAYAAVAKGIAVAGYMPNTYWVPLQSEETSTCLKPNPKQTPMAGVPSYIMPVEAAATPEPTASQIVVQQVLTTCKAAIVNCPQSLIATVTVNNTLDAAAATELPQTSSNSTFNETGDIGKRRDDNGNEILQRTANVWTTVEWKPMQTSEIKTINPAATQPAVPDLSTDHGNKDVGLRDRLKEGLANIF